MSLQNIYKKLSELNSKEFSEEFRFDKIDTDKVNKLQDSYKKSDKFIDLDRDNIKSTFHDYIIEYDCLDSIIDTNVKLGIGDGFLCIYDGIAYNSKIVKTLVVDNIYDYFIITKSYIINFSYSIKEKYTNSYSIFTHDLKLVESNLKKFDNHLDFLQYIGASVDNVIGPNVLDLTVYSDNGLKKSVLQYIPQLKTPIISIPLTGIVYIKYDLRDPDSIYHAPQYVHFDNIDVDKFSPSKKVDQSYSGRYFNNIGVYQNKFIKRDDHDNIVVKYDINSKDFINQSEKTVPSNQRLSAIFGDLYIYDRNILVNNDKEKRIFDNYYDSICGIYHNILIAKDYSGAKLILLDTKNNKAKVVKTINSKYYYLTQDGYLTDNSNVKSMYNILTDQEINIVDSATRFYDKDSLVYSAIENESKQYEVYVYKNGKMSDSKVFNSEEANDIFLFQNYKASISRINYSNNISHAGCIGFFGLVSKGSGAYHHNYNSRMLYNITYEKFSYTNYIDSENTVPEFSIIQGSSKFDRNRFIHIEYKYDNNTYSFSEPGIRYNLSIFNQYLFYSGSYRLLSNPKKVLTKPPIDGNVIYSNSEIVVTVDKTLGLLYIYDTDSLTKLKTINNQYFKGMSDYGIVMSDDYNLIFTTSDKYICYNLINSKFFYSTGGRAGHTVIINNKIYIYYLVDRGSGTQSNRTAYAMVFKVLEIKDNSLDTILAEQVGFSDDSINYYSDYKYNSRGYLHSIDRNRMSIKLYV